VSKTTDHVGDDGGEEEARAGTGWHYHGEAPPKPTAWLIKNVLPQTGVGLISGQWGSYKTTVALDLSVSAMTGAPFADRYPVKRCGGVAYFAAEGANGPASRLSAIASWRGHSGALPFAWKADCPPLMARDALATLTNEVAQAAAHFEEQFSVPLVLVLIDTLIAAAAYAKVGDENDAALAQKIMSVLSRLSAHAGALVLGLDHFGKAVETGTRGSSAKEGHADVVLAILADRELAGTVTNTRLAVRKLRDGAAGLELPFAAKSIEVGTDPDGDPITRVVIDWQQQTIKPADAVWPKALRLLRRVLTTVMADHGVDTTPFLDGPVVRAVDVEAVRSEFYRQYPADGDERQKATARRQAFYRAVKDAQAKGLVTTREVEGLQLMWLTRPAAP
jgi:AAA domain